MDITVKPRDISPILARIEEIKEKLKVATYEATKDSGDALQAAARRNFQGTHAPGFHRVGGDRPNTVTGHLAESIIFLQPVVAVGNAKYQTRIGPTAIYSRVIELGAHIDAKTAQYLHWFDAQMGVDRYKKSVDIPPYPYFRPAVEGMPLKMAAIFESAWREALS